MTNYPRGGSSYSNLFLSAAACFLMVWAAFVVPEGAIAQDEIPFRVERDRVIIPTSINGSDPLAVVLDTGMGLKGVYLFRREYEELMDASSRVQVQIPGAGKGAAPTALDEAALRAAHKIRFFPALDGAKPVAAWFSVPLGFPSRGR